MSIKEMRTKTELTQLQFADLIGTTVYSVRMWEQKNNCPEFVRGLIEYKLKNEKLI